MGKDAHPSFEAVSEFQEIRKRTNERGNIGDSVSILISEEKFDVKVYKIVTGIVVKYRSDGGRIVLDWNGKERSISGEDVRKYIRLIVKPKPDQAHENYLTIEHFASLKENEDFVQAQSKGFILREVGVSVAVLVTVDDKPTIKYGIISGCFHGNNGSNYHVMHRDGTESRYVSHGHTALI